MGLFKEHSPLLVYDGNVTLYVGEELGFLWASITFLINDITDYGATNKP